VGADRAGERLEFIQALRGLACAGVVLYHARIFIDGAAYLGVGSRLFEAGACGVDLFFVISGFILVHTTRRLEPSSSAALTFLIKRLVRIVPVYALAYGAMWLLVRGLPNPEFHPTWSDVGRTFAFYPQDPRAAAPFFGYPLLYPGWSLNYQAYFYVVFAVSIVFRRLRYVALFALLAVPLLIVPYWQAGEVHLDAARSYGLDGYLCIAADPIVWELAIGVVIGLVYDSRLAIRDRGAAGVLVAIATGWAAWQCLTGWRAGHGLTGWGGAMAGLVFALAIYDKSHAIRPPRWLIWLGDVSYSLYLFHVLPKLLPSVFPGSVLMIGGGFFVACLVMGGVLAYLSYRGLEENVTPWLRARLLRGPRNGNGNGQRAP